MTYEPKHQPPYTQQPPQGPVNYDEPPRHCPKVSGLMGSGVWFPEGWSRSGCMLVAAA